METPKRLTINEFSKLTGFSHTTIFNAIKDKEIPFVLVYSDPHRKPHYEIIVNNKALAFKPKRSRKCNSKLYDKTFKNMEGWQARSRIMSCY